MIDITAFIMGTCHPTRISWLKETINHMDEQNFPFVKKILAVDQFHGHTFPHDFRDELVNRGWIVIIDSHMSRVKSMDNAFKFIDSEFIFYNEEDVKATLPNIGDLDYMFNTLDYNGKKCGMVSLTLGGSSNHFPANEYGDLKEIKNNLLLQNENYLIFRRLEEKRDAHFFEFPGLFIRKNLFIDCHETAKNLFPHRQIEQGLTLAYFKNGYDNQYIKTSVAKNNIYEIIDTSPNDFISKCRLLENLDPQQGNSGLGGNHNY